MSEMSIQHQRSSTPLSTNAWKRKQALEWILSNLPPRGHKTAVARHASRICISALHLPSAFFSCGPADRSSPQTPSTSESGGARSQIGVEVGSIMSACCDTTFETHQLTEPLFFPAEHPVWRRIRNFGAPDFTADTVSLLCSPSRLSLAAILDWTGPSIVLYIYCGQLEPASPFSTPRTFSSSSHDTEQDGARSTRRGGKRGFVIKYIRLAPV